MSKRKKLFKDISDQWKEEHLEALAWAFALIAAADRNIAYAETHRFLDVARDQFELEHVPFGHLAARFDDAVEAILNDPDRGWAQAMDAIRAAVDHGLRVKDVISAARIAVVADLRIEKVEETALHRLASELGVDPDAV